MSILNVSYAEINTKNPEEASQIINMLKLQTGKVDIDPNEIDWKYEKLQNDKYCLLGILNEERACYTVKPSEILKNKGGHILELIFPLPKGIIEKKAYIYNREEVKNKLIKKHNLDLPVTKLCLEALIEMYN